jgi:hypothetical protein
MVKSLWLRVGQFLPRLKVEHQIELSGLINLLSRYQNNCNQGLNKYCALTLMASLFTITMCWMELKHASRNE